MNKNGKTKIRISDHVVYALRKENLTVEDLFAQFKELLREDYGLVDMLNVYKIDFFVDSDPEIELLFMTYGPRKMSKSFEAWIMAKLQGRD